MSRLYRLYRHAKKAGPARRGQLEPGFCDPRNQPFTAEIELAADATESNGQASLFVAESRKHREVREAQVSMRGQYQTVTAGGMPSLSIAGAVIRYAFYAVGTLVLGMVGLGIMSLWKIPAKPVNAAPAFRINASEFASKPTSGHVVTSSRLGRAEVMQYGQLHSRTNDLAVVLVMPPKGIGMGSSLVQDLTDVNLLRLKRTTFTQTHYDLDTRFGEFRATEMRVDTDGRWKQCLAYRSRLDTSAVYLTGWYCDGSGSRPSPNALACILDKLVLEQELASKEADSFLRGRMSKSAYCQAEPVTQTTDTGHRGVSPPSRWSQPSAQRRYYY